MTFNRNYIVLLSVFLTMNRITAQDLGNLKTTKPISYNGGLNLQTGFYGISGAKARQPGFTYMMNGSANINIYGVALPFNFTFSNFQRDFRQPFNQFGLSPTYKWLTLHAGYRNISYSQFSMAGYTIAGAGVEAKPGNWRLALLYGRSQKAVAEDTLKTIENSLNGINAPAYKRFILSGKIGYGTNDNFADVIFLKGKDDSSSIPYRPVNSQILPSKNLVFGLNSQLSFLKKKLIWMGEGALSIYTRDIAMSTQNTGYGLVDALIQPNLSSQTYTAMETQLNYTELAYGFGIKYRKVNPDYKSMGAYFFQTDFEQVLLNAKFNLFKNKLRLNGSFGNQKDNLQRKKLATTSRQIYNAAVSFNPNTKFGVDVAFSNYGTSQRAGRRTLSDTAVINQINNSISITPRYVIVKEKFIRTLILIAGRQSLDDRNRFTEQYTQVNNTFANAIHTVSFIKEAFSYNYGLNYNSSHTVVGTTNLYGAIGGCSKSWKKGTFTMDFNSTINSSTFNSEFNGLTMGFQHNINWKPHKKHRFFINSVLTINRSKNTQAGSSFNEYYTKFNYAFTF